MFLLLFLLFIIILLLLQAENDMGICLSVIKLVV